MLSQKDRDRIIELKQHYQEYGSDKKVISLFQKVIKGYYKQHGRSFDWRSTTNPYHIVVSEIMLQQTQTERVKTKYIEFITAFPDFFSLAKAPLQEVLKVWQGMGYNRRGVALQRIAQIVTNDCNGNLPKSVEILQTYPGIGYATASSILAFTYNMPTVFIETNIRRVFIHFFFEDQENVKDKDILTLVEATLDKKNARHWYYALMDYGVMLKKTISNPNVRSAHYRKQSKFEGSNRQVRGQIIKHLSVSDAPISAKKLATLLDNDIEIVQKNIEQLRKEGFLLKKGDKVAIG